MTWIDAINWIAVLNVAVAVAGIAMSVVPLDQTRLIVKSKSSATVSLWMPLVFLAGVSLLLVYAIQLHATALIVAEIAGVICNGISLAVILHYRGEKEPAPAPKLLDLKLHLRGRLLFDHLSELQMPREEYAMQLLEELELFLGVSEIKAAELTQGASCNIHCPRAIEDAMSEAFGLQPPSTPLGHDRYRISFNAVNPLSSDEATAALEGQQRAVEFVAQHNAALTQAREDWQDIFGDFCVAAEDFRVYRNRVYRSEQRVKAGLGQCHALLLRSLREQTDG